MQETNLRKRSLLIGLLGLISVGFLGELALEFLGFGKPALVRTDSPANYELVANQNVRRMWPLSDSWVAHVRTNEYGMRSDPVSPTRITGTRRLYFLGDSMTWGTTQVDQSQIFTEIVHRDLPKLIQEPVEVLNGAISGWAPSNELEYLKEHGTQHADRVILALNAGDPMQPMSGKPNGFAIPSLECHPTFGYEELWIRVIEPTLARDLYLLHFRSSPGPDLKDPGIDVISNEQALTENLAKIDEISQFSEASGAKLSIVFFGIDPPGMNTAALPVEKRGRDAVARWAAANDVPFIDLGPQLSDYPAASIRLRDQVHFNVRGHAIVARAILSAWNRVDPVSTAPSAK